MGARTGASFPRGIAALLLALLCAAPLRAGAAPPADAPAMAEPPPAPLQPGAAPAAGATESLETYVERGSALFKAHRYAEAAGMLQQAYALEPRPLFLFNMAQAYRRAGRIRDACPLYRRFLQEDPRTPLRAETEGYIAELEVVIAEQDRAERERRRPIYKKGWFWGVVAASAAVAIGTGLGLGLGLGLRDNRSVVDLAFPLRLR